MTFQLKMFCDFEIIESDSTRTPGYSLRSHGPIPSGLTDFVGTVCLNVPQTDPPPSRRSLPWSDFSLWSQDLAFLKADLTSKDWVEVLLEFLGLFHQVFFPPLSKFSSRRALAFLSPSLSTGTVSWQFSWVSCSCSHLLHPSKTQQIATI